MAITGFQAKEECCSIELCSGHAAGLKGAIHDVRQALLVEDWEVLTEADTNSLYGEDEYGEDKYGEEEVSAGEPATQLTEETSEEDLADHESDGGGAMEPLTTWDEDPQNPNPLSCGALLVDAKNGFQNQGRLSALWAVVWLTGVWLKIVAAIPREPHDGKLLAKYCYKRMQLNIN